MTEFEVDCKFGTHRIRMMGSKETGWKAYNLLDNTPHNCRDQKNIQRQQPSPQKPLGDEKPMGILSPAMEAAIDKRIREIVEDILVKRGTDSNSSETGAGQVKLEEILFAERGEQRIGQFIWNALAKAGKWKAPEANALFYISDDDLEHYLREFLRPQP